MKLTRAALLTILALGAALTYFVARIQQKGPTLPPGHVCRLSTSWPAWRYRFLKGPGLLMCGPYAFAVLPNRAVFTPTEDRRAIAQFDWSGNLVHMWRANSCSDALSDVAVSGQTLVAGSWDASRIVVFDMKTGNDRVVNLSDGAKTSLPEDLDSPVVARVEIDSNHGIHAILKRSKGYAHAVVSPDMNHVEMRPDPFASGGIPSPYGGLAGKKNIDVHLELGYDIVHTELHSYENGHGETVLDSFEGDKLILADLIGYSADGSLYFTCVRAAASKHPAAFEVYRFRYGKPRQYLADLGWPYPVVPTWQGEPRKFVVTSDGSVYEMDTVTRPTQAGQRMEFDLVKLHSKIPVQ